MRITLDSIADAVIATDTAGKVVHMNPIAENLTGWTQRQALGRPLTEVFHIINAHTREVVANSVEKVLAQGQVVGLAGQTILKSRTGIEYQIEDSAAPIEDEKNNLRGVVLVFRDVTEKYHVEQELLKMRKLESIGVLAGGIAHDFNNLRPIILIVIAIIQPDCPVNTSELSFKMRGLVFPLSISIKYLVPIFQPNQMDMDWG